MGLIIMKTPFIQIAFAGLFFMASCSSLKNTPENIQELTQKIQTNDFTFVAKYANTMRGKQIYLNSEYDLRIKNDSAFAFLPYFGVAYIVPYGGDGGIKFAEPMVGYSMKPNNKSDGWDIRFKIKAKECDYDISMNIFNNGSTMLAVSSFNKDVITFTGEVTKQAQ